MARKPKLDTTLAEAVDVARNALIEIAAETEIGEYLGATPEGERLVTHRFVSQKRGYRGWTWFATIARVPRAKAKDLTVCEAGIVAGEDALLAPAWVPWAERLVKEEIEAAEAEANEPKDEPGPSATATENSGAENTAAEPAGNETQEDLTESTTATDEHEATGEPEATSEQGIKTPARRQVRRRRTAQRTAARRRAAQRNRSRKES
ncbi:DUF3027 domain-containing protein [Glutamicibacter sp. 287]|uniref:DUF3027 domain-containing protein n=1 Tax=unclassified Glutamicibacter TaxID=2627139 RepID=UPI000BB858D2|nr:DUF3027 domain-containing protein [Glutamicibacter sp. BW80]PCC27213.1 hypothetical protein CIK76_18505 [Glutamicibacter sp. BW80]